MGPSTGEMGWTGISRTAVVSAMAVGGIMAVGCGRPELSQGESCDVNTDCDSPLVCELDRCRRQCAESRDCAAGLTCLLVSKEFGGVCQLPTEASCVLTSNCPAPLVCQMGTCGTACEEDRDCLEGSSCEGMGLDRACVEPPEDCIYTSDCEYPAVCVVGGRCQLECADDIDCLEPRVCSLAPDFLCVLPGAPP